MNKMNFLLKINHKTRLKLTVLLSMLSVVGLYILWNYETGFLGGFITGITIALTLVLVSSLKKA